jgi:hypothetical protein
VSFKPFGYRFEICSPLSVPAAKDAIRRKKSGWFESKESPRGWILGPMLCLWRSAFNQHGPMVFAILKEDELGARIVGRAGADLNGTALFLLITPLMGWITWQMHQDGQGSTRGYIVIGLLFGLGLPLTLWINSKDRRDADPLVNFLRRAVQPTSKKIKKRQSVGAVDGASLVLNGTERKEPISGSDLEEAVIQLGTGDFMILGFAPERYMQLMVESDRFHIEKREGSANYHYEADLPKSDTNDGDQYDASYERLLDRLLDYLYSREPVQDLNWKHVSL